MGQSGWEDTAQIYFVELGDDPLAGRFILHHLVAEKYSGPFPLPWDGFENFSAIVAPRLEFETEEPNVWPHINKDYAERNKAVFPSDRLAQLPKARF